MKTVLRCRNHSRLSLLGMEVASRRRVLVRAATAILGLAMAGNAPASDRGVRLVQTAIPMADGVQLAATLYMPADLRREERLPALLEYLPYRKDDDTPDYATHAYFARHGYVGVRVDIRGFGNSGGAPPTREYSAQEQEDGEQVIAWLARQPWSNGNVGMLGISWGGFNSIQMAMRHPPALKAILAIAATEALFNEDVHYMDGIMHVDEFEIAMDLDQGRTTVTWRGTAATVFPWGSFEHREQLVYRIDDAHPESSAVEGEAESVEHLKNRVLTYRGHLALTGDASTFHYAASRTLLRDGVVLRTKRWMEDIPRDLQ